MSIQLTAEQREALGLANSSVAEREQFLQQIGRMVFDNSMLKLIRTLTEEQMHALGYAIDSLDSFDSVVAYLLDTYPSFETYLREAEGDFVKTFVEEFKKGN